MSLINEALKKAQRQRSLDNAPLSSAPSGVAAAAVTTHVRAASHRRSSASIYLGIGLLALGVAGTAVMMRYGFPSAAPVPVAENPVATVSQSLPPANVEPVAARSGSRVAVESSAPVTVTMPSVTVVGKVPSAPAAPPPLPAPAPQLVTPTANVTAAEEARVVPAQPVVVVAAVPPAPKPAGPSDAEREARAQAFVGALRLTGVRGLGAQARVLINEKVYRLNDTIEPAIPLRLSAVRSGLLVFTDGKGRTYEKTY